MTTHTTKMTRKGQITIPVAIREALDIHEGDVLVAERRENEIVLIRQQDVVDWTSGYLREYAKGRHLSPHEIRATAAQAIADLLVLGEFEGVRIVSPAAFTHILDGGHDTAEYP